MTKCLLCETHPDLGVMLKTLLEIDGDLVRLLNRTEPETIISEIKQEKPDFLIIDDPDISTSSNLFTEIRKAEFSNMKTIMIINMDQERAFALTDQVKTLTRPFLPLELTSLLHQLENRI